MPRPAQTLLTLATRDQTAAAGTLAAAHVAAARAEDHETLSRIAAHSGTGPELLAELAAHPAAVVRSSAAVNRSTPPQALVAALRTERATAVLYACLAFPDPDVVAAALPRLRVLGNQTKVAHALGIAVKNPATVTILRQVLALAGECGSSRIEGDELAQRIADAGWDLEEFVAAAAGWPSTLGAETAAALAALWPEHADTLAPMALAVLLDPQANPVTSSDVSQAWVRQADELCRRTPALTPYIRERALAFAHQGGNHAWKHLLSQLDVEAASSEAEHILPALDTAALARVVDRPRDADWSEVVAALVTMSADGTVDWPADHDPAWWRLCAALGDSVTGRKESARHAARLHPAVLATLAFGTSNSEVRETFFGSLTEGQRAAVAAVMMTQLHMVPEWARHGDSQFGEAVTAQTLAATPFGRAVDVAQYSKPVRRALETSLAPLLADPARALVFLSFDDNGGFPGTVAELEAVLRSCAD